MIINDDSALDAVEVSCDRIFGSFGGRWSGALTAADFDLPQADIDAATLTAFHRISRNHYNGAFVEKPKALASDEVEVCDCSAADSCAENCPNRATFVECSAKCAHGDRCKNQRIKRRQWAKTAVKMTRDRGGGLFASEAICSGRLIIEYVGEIIDTAECAARLQTNKTRGLADFYMFQLSREHVIDAGPMGSDARFANHSCDPNAKTELWHVGPQRRVGLFALRNIAAGEEITYDYHCQGFWSAGDEQQCKCGADNCRRHLGAKPVSIPNGKRKPAPSNVDFITASDTVQVFGGVWRLPKSVDFDESTEMAQMIQRKTEQRKRQKKVQHERDNAAAAAATDTDTVPPPPPPMRLAPPHEPQTNCVTDADECAADMDIDDRLDAAVPQSLSPLSTLSSSPLRSPPLSPVAHPNGGDYIFADGIDDDQQTPPLFIDASTAYDHIKHKVNDGDDDNESDLLRYRHSASATATATATASASAVQFANS